MESDPSKDTNSLLVYGFVAVLIVSCVCLLAIIMHKKHKKNKYHSIRSNGIQLDIASATLKELKDQAYYYCTTKNDVALEQFLREMLTKTNYNIEDLYLSRLGSLLGLASKLGYKQMVTVLLKCGADVHEKDKKGETALHSVARNGQYDVMKLLLDHNADPNEINKRGWSPLHWSCVNGRSVETKLLLESKADPSLKVYVQERTPLHYAVQNGHEKDTRLLLEYNADISGPDADGNTPILICARNGSIPILNLLLEHNANPYDRNNQDHGVLMRAAERGLCDFVSQLIPLDPANNLRELVRVIELIQGLDSTDEEADRQRKLQLVLRRVVETKEFLADFLRLFTDKIQSVAIDYMENHAYASLFETLEISVNQFCWLIDFILRDNKYSESSKFMGDMIDQVYPIFSYITEKFSSCQSKLAQRDDNIRNDNDTEKDHPELQFLGEVVCKVLGQYYKLCRPCLSIPDYQDALRLQFSTFISQYHAIFAKLIQRRPVILYESLEFLLDFSSCMPNFTELKNLLSFEESRQWFYRKINEEKDKHTEQNITIHISRSNCLLSSCNSLMVKSSKLFGKFNVVFDGEEGTGAGVRREWFLAISEEIFDPNNALFLLCHDGTLQPNPSSSVNQDHLSYFRFAGRVMGLALFHEELLNVHFTRAFYKHILSVKPCFQDLESTDPEYFRNLQQLMEMENVEDLGLTLSSEANEFGQVSVVDLIENGRNIPLTDDNKELYMELVSELKLTTAIRQQIDMFRDGFYDIVPLRFISIFNDLQLELLISGVPNIDAADWEKNTVYNGYQADSEQIVWFWEIVNQFDQDKRAMLLQFATGTSRLPVGGFANLPGFEGPAKFTILASPAVDNFPTASTCFNLLKLPQYPTKEVMEEKLVYAILNGATGFTMA